MIRSARETTIGIVWLNTYSNDKKECNIKHTRATWKICATIGLSATVVNSNSVVEGWGWSRSRSLDVG